VDDGCYADNAASLPSPLAERVINSRNQVVYLP